MLAPSTVSTDADSVPNPYRDRLQDLLLHTGVRINGPGATDIEVRDPRLYRRVLRGGIPEFCRAYVDGWWECEDLEGLFEGLARVKVGSLPFSMKWPELKLLLLSRFINMQSAKRAYFVGKHHYDRGNDLFEKMLDPTMAYSCAYFGRQAQTLEQAQLDKYELICKKLQLKPGMQVLDIGCGWGGLAAYMVKKYKVQVVGITVSEEQATLIRERHGSLFEVLVADYRSLPERYLGYFDRIESVGMFEHVGQKNYKTFFQVAYAYLKPDGLFLLHSIGGSGRPSAWIHADVFPNGILPSESQITRAYRGRFTLRDWHNFGQDYARTLRFWHSRSERARAELPAEKYDERFWRFWRLYLLSCAGGFLAGRTQLWQMVFSKPGHHVEYRSIR